ncbi:TonB-dependent siderophore receptor [Sinorhizobium sp. BG8]|nr:TonB-dependent siderophore receptor [Sinorhizobium sp. BG8]
MASVAVPALAQQQAEKGERAGKTQYTIPAGPLGAAITRFGDRSNLQVLYPADLVRGKQTAGLSGSYTPEAALAQLLANTGLTYRFTSANTVTISDPRLTPAGVSGLIDGSTPLDPIQVEGLGQTTENTGSYTTGQMSTATGLPLPIRETPQSVTVVTSQLMQDQEATTISDALTSATGITLQQYDSDRTEFFARGFALTEFQYDGVVVQTDGVYDYGLSNADMTIYDRIEIVKGANGLLQGAGSPGAAVNLVRKRPTDEFQASLTGGVGSWQTYRTEMDVSGPLNADGSLRGRFAGSYENGESYLDHYKKEKFTLYGVLEADITDNTTLTVGSDYQRNLPRGTSWTGLPMFYSDGTTTDWDVSTNPATDWSRRDTYTNNYFATLAHEFDNGWNLDLTFNHRRDGHDSVLGSAGGGWPDPVTGAGVFQYVGKYEGRVIQNTFDVKASGPIELFGREHDLMVGATASRSTDKGPWYSYGGVGYDPSVPNFFEWDGDTEEPDFDVLGRYETKLVQYGTYAAVRLKPTDDLSVILGSRISWWDFDDKGTYDNATNTWAGAASYSVKGEVTPYFGVVYDVTDVYSVYGSYTSIFKPQGNQDASGNYLDPEQGHSFETGVKGSFFDGALNTTAALFLTKQDNLAEQAGYDPVTGTYYYTAADGVTTKGFEIEASGEIRPDWNIYAGYTYSHARKKNGDRVYSFVQTAAPENVVKLFTTYRLPGEWEKLTIGGGVRWQDKIYGYVWSPANVYEDFTQKNVFLVDLMARYSFNEKVDVTFNVKNALNEKYFTTLGNFDTGFYGEPRSFNVSTKFKF